MTGYAQAPADCPNRSLMARKLVSNLFFLSGHPQVPPPMRSMLANLRTRWQPALVDAPVPEVSGQPARCGTALRRVCIEMTRGPFEAQTNPMHPSHKAHELQAVTPLTARERLVRQRAQAALDRCPGWLGAGRRWQVFVEPACTCGCTEPVRARR